jgi:hypothetical protein
LLCVALCLAAAAWKPVLTCKEHTILYSTIMNLGLNLKKKYIYIYMSYSQTPRKHIIQTGGMYPTVFSNTIYSQVSAGKH